MIDAQRAACAAYIDYATVPAQRTLPFSFSLDGVTETVQGGQRFCYTVLGHGTGGSAEVDLSHFLFVTCDELTLSDLITAEVTIDGQPMNVSIGDNVTVMTAQNPDPTTGCTGIKFDFGLDKVAGVMTVCFTLGRAFSVGAVPVCVKGGQVSLRSLSICGPVCQGDTASCETVVYQRANICVPVTIRPFARVGEIVTRCCGASTITSGAAACAASRTPSCQFTVSQELCMSIPVAFGASAQVGAASAVCQGATAQDTCADCGASAAAVPGGFACQTFM